MLSRPRSAGNPSTRLVEAVNFETRIDKMMRDARMGKYTKVCCDETSRKGLKSLIRLFGLYGHSGVREILDFLVCMQKCGVVPPQPNVLPKPQPAPEPQPEPKPVACVPGLPPPGKRGN